MHKLLLHLRRWLLGEESLSDKLRAVEEHYIDQGQWHCSLLLNYKILQVLDTADLDATNYDYDSIVIVTGFKDISHLFNWADMVLSLIQAREPLTYDVNSFTYNRIPKTLGEFTATKAGSRYGIPKLKYDLLEILGKLHTHLGNISNTRYLDTCNAVLTLVWVDIYAIVEGICAVGVNHE